MLDLVEADEAFISGVLNQPVDPENYYAHLMGRTCIEAAKYGLYVVAVAMVNAIMVCITLEKEK